NVLLSSPVVVTFSKPIDPATVSGANAANVALTGPGGASVAGAVSLNSSNTVLTFRPSAPFESNSQYALALAAGIADPAGRPLGAQFTSSFSSLDTTPPAPPPAGSITATIPDGAGRTTVTGAQGTAGQQDTVSVINLTTGAVTPVLIDPNGGFQTL